VQIALYSDEACGRTSIGRLVCWGHSGGSVPAPTEIGFLDMDLGSYDYLCAVRSTGETACYSPGYPDSLVNTPWHAALPGAGYVRIANDGYSVCAVRQDGTVACRGGYTR